MCVFMRGGGEKERITESQTSYVAKQTRVKSGISPNPLITHPNALLVTASLTLLGNHRLGAVPSEPIFLSKAYARHPAEALLARAPESVPPLLMSAHKL